MKCPYSSGLFLLLTIRGELPDRQHYLRHSQALTLARQILTPIRPDVIAGILQRKGINSFLSQQITHNVLSDIVRLDQRPNQWLFSIFRLLIHPAHSKTQHDSEQVLIRLIGFDDLRAPGYMHGLNFETVKRIPSLGVEAFRMLGAGCRQVDIRNAEAIDGLLQERLAVRHQAYSGSSEITCRSSGRDHLATRAAGLAGGCTVRQRAFAPAATTESLGLAAGASCPARSHR